MAQIVNRRAEEFQLWKLPHLAIKSIIHMWKLDQIIHLSIISKRFKRFLMTYKLFGVHINFEFLYREESFTFRGLTTPETPFKNDIGIDIRRFKSGFSMVTRVGMFVGVGRKERSFSRFNKKGNLNGKPCVFVKYNEGFVFGKGVDMADQERLEYLAEVLKHLQSFCHVKTYNLRHRQNAEFQIFDCSIWSLVPKFNRLEIERDMLRGGDVSQDHIKFLMNQVKVDNMRLYLTVFESERLEPIRLTSRKVYLEDCSWLKWESIVNSESEQIKTLSLIQVKEDMIVEMLEKWRNGEILGNLKKLEFSTFFKFPEKMEKLDKLEWVTKLTEQEMSTVKSKELNFGHKTDLKRIQRVSDKKWAVFEIKGSIYLHILENDYKF